MIQQEEQVQKDKQEKEKIPMKINPQLIEHFSYLKNYNYQFLSVIGKGGYGYVIKVCQLTQPNKIFAIKMNFQTIQRELIYTQMIYFKLFNKLRNFPKLEKMFLHNDCPHVVTQYFEHHHFSKILVNSKMEDVKKYLYQLLLALKTLKEFGIFHRDIKPDNFLYNPETQRGILIDFGTAEVDFEFLKYIYNKVQTARAENKQCKQDEIYLQIYKKLVGCMQKIGQFKIGTQPYMPLQSTLFYKKQDYQSDIWPVGIIFLQFVVQKYNIFNDIKLNHMKGGVRNPKHLYSIKQLMELSNFFGQQMIQQCKSYGYKLKIPEHLHKKVDFKQIANIDNFDDDANDLLKGLLTIDPNKRIKVEDALKHPFFDSIKIKKKPKIKVIIKRKIQTPLQKQLRELRQHYVKPKIKTVKKQDFKKPKPILLESEKL